MKKYIVANNNNTIFLGFKGDIIELNFIPAKSKKEATKFNSFDEAEFWMGLLEEHCKSLMRKSDILLHTEREFLRLMLDVKQICCISI